MQTLVLKYIMALGLTIALVSCQPLELSKKALPTNFGDDAVVSLNLSSTSVSATTIDLGSTVSVLVSVFDSQGNVFDHRSVPVTCVLSGGTSAGTFSAAMDNGNGTYSLTLTSSAAGTASSVACSLAGEETSSTAPTVTVVFNPTAIATLAAWYDAAQLGLSDGNSVSSWPDLSGQANHLTQVTGSAQPTLNTSQINSQPAVTFDGNDYLQFTTNISMQPATVFIVGKYSGTAAYPYLGNDSNNVFIGYVGSTVYYYSTVANLNVANANPSAFQVYSVNAMPSGTNSNILVNGTSVMSADLNWGASTIAYMGRRNAERFLGQIAEIIIYSSNISASDIALVNQYLSDKYGISLP